MPSKTKKYMSFTKELLTSDMSLSSRKVECWDHRSPHAYVSRTAQCKLGSAGEANP